MTGWVYMIVNRSMRGLVKIGFTDRDPDTRAQELSHTGSPYPYEVIFTVEVDHAALIEKRTHQLLAKYHAGKEWFRCPVHIAQSAIQEACEGRPYAVGSSSGNGVGGSPLVPGHALTPYFPDSTKTQPSHSSSARGAENESDDSPFPPGHPLRGLL